jgi:thymidylate synthase
MNTYKNLNQALYGEIDNIEKNGLEVNSRGSHQKEVLYRNLKIEDPTDLTIVYPSRKFSDAYAKSEWLWYLSSNRSIVNIGKLAVIWDMIKDINCEVESNYGEYLFNNTTRTSHSQWGWVIRELRKDPDSRRATIAINQPKHKGKNALDIPCTQYLQFFIRENKLHLGVCMRSNDIVYGFCNDVFTFCLFQQMMYNELRRSVKFKNLELGNYFHHAGSMHIYEKHFKMAKNILNEDSYYNSEDHKKIELFKKVIYTYIYNQRLYLPTDDLSKEEIRDFVFTISKKLFK